MKYYLILFVVLFFAVSSFCEEIYRLRIENSAGGLIQVSLDRGRNYSAVGEAVHPADKTNPGFMASDYIKGGTVCASASHAIRIKVSPKEKKTENFKNVRIFSIIPKEFWSLPKGFGGFVSGSSGIYTNIHTAESIFNIFAPFPESPVFLETEEGLVPIPENYIPQYGDIYVITVMRPALENTYIDFENTKGGSVRTETQTITRCEKPLSGVGRYDATTYNSPGQLNTVHGGVITVASSPLFPYSQQEGSPQETRGGFMIQPYYHTVRQGETRPQVMILGMPQNIFQLEGKPPLYSGNIGLWYYRDHPEKSYYASLKAGNTLLNVPPLSGKNDNALTKDYLNTHTTINLKEEISGIRIHIPEFDSSLAEEYLNKISLDFCTEKEKAFPVSDSVYTPDINLPQNYREIHYYIDGKLKGIATETSDIKIHTSDYKKGLHHLKVTACKNSKPICRFSFYFFAK